ncbi:putative AlkP superfamily pyrophosphatase or phosphodiesterase [Lacinutrix venerupis]|uniref:alkaline phosphatase PafA n=1 Tax=Lacinutrix venerupis TaxID=1486034 RepID=UPI000EAFC79B|nr:alkaline phosphatase PafA [Lacinutrix venerupis]RLJ62540.1 putative AlkP superfamily pyrophosphatase or phosphodiesterase [Lacinutrix venerupis]
MRFLSIIFLSVFLFNCNAQSNVIQVKPQEEVTLNANPKLVVGVVVDQMRYDYLTRFYNKYGNDGFKRLINDGFNCKNNHYNYVPTFTGPGHASIYTGTSPKNHGIIANNWYNKFSKKMVYCAEDSTVVAVGSDTDQEKMSPRRMKTTSFADENRLHTQLKGKTIGISIKDRGAILPAGHSANAAYWFRGKDEGNFITSNYYMNSLPQWVNDFNATTTAESYLREWNTLYDINTYTESGSDLNVFETGFKGKDNATFPYDLATLKDKNGGFDIIKATPFGNSIVADFAIKAIDGEQLGQDNITDVLTVSFSSTDYVGHNFGVNSKEIEDTYIRLDKDLARLFKALDEKIGVGEYTLFLTSDHGAVEVPAYLQSVKIPAGYFNRDEFKTKLNNFLVKEFSASDLIENISNDQIFLNKARLKQFNLKLEDVQYAIVNEVINYNHIDKAYSAKTMQSSTFFGGIEALLQNGYHQKRSGDIILVKDPAVISYSKTGSTHGSGSTFDTHVPLLFYGNGIKKGSTLTKTEITDIAPTISALLGISFPNGATGNVLDFVID